MTRPRGDLLKAHVLDRMALASQAVGPRDLRLCRCETRSTLRYWRQERWVRPIDYTSEGVALFDLDQVRIVRDTPAPQRAKV